MRFVNGKYVGLTTEELTAMEADRRKTELMERIRPLTEAEVSRMLLAEQINTFSVDDNTALRMKEFYPSWESGKAYSVGYKVRYKDKLWKCRQAHTAQVGWEPGETGTESLWEQVCETHGGTLDDPIPYDGNMALEEGKHYHQEFVIYRCVRATGAPVYHALSGLVGLYVEVV